MIFHEITESAIKNAVENIEILNMNEVYSQQARQILDRLVGFKISPILWKNINTKKSLSAGRCQSAPLKNSLKNVMNTLETINQKKIYTITGSFKGNDKIYLYTKKGEKKQKPFLKCFLEESVILRNQYSFEKQIKDYPDKPFTNSTLQQTA